MVKKILFISMSLFCLVAKGQNFDSSMSYSRVALVYYDQDSNGFFHKKENINLKKVTDIISIYGYYKKSQELYCITNRANVIITLNETFAKIYKKSKAIPQLKEKDIPALVEAKNKELEAQYERINTARLKFINDSIERAKADSVKRAINDSLKLVAAAKAEIDYKNSHEWCWVPTKSKYLYCPLCEKSITMKDSTLCYAIRNDSIYWGEYDKGIFGFGYIRIHAAKLSNELLKDKAFQYHYNVYSDSLENRIKMNRGIAAYRNYINIDEHLGKIKKYAPNGFFNSWSWDKEYSSISFNFKYTNTNKKTIKYIEVFWVCTNDVNDVRRSGSFRGTGPLEEWDSASWNWDNSSYYVAGDATNMRITKVLITYMDGSKVTIPKDKLRFE